MTKQLKEYREVAVEGAQRRKQPSDSRVLSAIAQLEYEKQNVVMKDVKTDEHFEFVDDEVVMACRKMQNLSTRDITQDEAEDKIAEIKLKTAISDIKTVTKIVTDMLPHLLYNSQSLNHREGEAYLIIELLKVFFTNCLVSKLIGMKYDWLTYHLLPHPNHPMNQTVLPDFVMFVEPLSAIMFELLFVEVKRRGNKSNGNSESDLVKLGKEMQIALNKLMFQGVVDPEVVAYLLKMDLRFNGQYRMIEISKFYISMKSVDDLMVLPSILEKLAQVKKIIQSTMKKLYESIEDEEKKDDFSQYTRMACGLPVQVKNNK
ncbi:hypothetical protein G6F47_012291 [Rhizopus delemar]|nr:hypothetical protein G6F52_001480 [Rhizopus delemar]KAG1540772.1 hypothetical protein G6F49_012044 [Rhizopus delemar]KAG1582088.1 hypothetical protein G6F47_012291 [Rhizopus delemar]